jgi:hypothetical protein
MSKLNWYASVNRSKNNQSGTAIKLTKEKHLNTLLFINQVFNRVEELLTRKKDQEEDPDLPSFLLNDEDWKRIKDELLPKDNETKFVKILYGAQAEFCIICHEDFKQDIMNTELMRVEAEKQRKKEEEEEKSKKKKKNGKRSKK